MQIEEAKKIFIDVLESMPGVKKIVYEPEEDKNKKLPNFKVEKTEKGFDFMITLIVLLSTNVKQLVSQIGETLRYVMKKNGAYVNKLNIFIEGITND